MGFLNVFSAYSSKSLLITAQGILANISNQAMMCFRQLGKIYKTAGAGKNLELDLLPGEHDWGGNKAVEFFRRHLS
ncbi:MAG: hypothetical protein Q7J98_02120 [Kiritimatiellia bacterium]|nr:hypothetical protein [Kiritimatiellia bacterium]